MPRLRELQLSRMSDLLAQYSMRKLGQSGSGRLPDGYAIE